jgi:peptide/nickel transport system substrate-binding protein
MANETRDLGQEAFDRYLHMYRKGQLTRREFIRIASVLAVSAMGAATLPGCAAPATAPTTAAPAAAPVATAATAATVAPTAAAAGAIKDTISTAFDFDMPTLNPQMATLGELNMIALNLYGTIVRREIPSMKIYPWLLTDLKPIDPLTWEGTIKDGVTFQNGEPFNADSIKFTYERVVDPAIKSPQASYMGPLTGVEVINPLKVRWHFKSPHPIFLIRSAQLFLLAPKYFKEKGDDYAAQNPVGTGPYKFVEWKKNQSITFTKWDQYWNKDKEGFYKNIVFRSIPEKATQIAELLSGNLDVIRAIPLDQRKAIESSASNKIIIAGSPVVGFVVLDAMGKTGKTPLQDVRVRQALNYALPMDDYIKTLVPGGKRTPAGYYQGGFAYDSTVKPYEYDPAKAKQLLAEAGFPNGIDFRFLISTAQVGPNATQVYQAMQQDWLKVGIRSDNQIMEHNAMTTAVTQGKGGPAYMWNWSGEFDPDMCFPFYVHSTGVYSYNNDPVLDKLIDDGRAGADDATRIKFYSQLQQKVRDQALYVFMWNWDQVFGVNKSVNFSPLPEDQWERYSEFKPATT